MSDAPEPPKQGDDDAAQSAGSALRERAEAILRKHGDASPAYDLALPPEQLRRVLHDLRVHQIELEMQNDELRRAQIEVDAARARYFDLYELAPVGYCSISGAGLVMEANLTLATLFGVGRGTLRGRLLSDFVLGEDRDLLFLLRRRLVKVDGPQSCELRMLRARAAPFWAHLAATMAQDAAGAQVCRVVVSDISARKEAENARASAQDQLREAHKMRALGTLASGVAHEFNNVLMIIMGNLEVTGMDPGLSPQSLTSLDGIRKAAARAKALVRQILLFGRHEIHSREPIALAPVVMESVRMLRATLPAQVDLRVECAPDVPPVLADASHLEHVLLNLVNNAWQAPMVRARPKVIEIRLDTHMQTGEPAGEPRVRFAGMPLSPGHYVRLSVRDNGAGMDAATVNRLFEPFFTTKRVGEGTGLGLWVVFGIIQEHGASIAVDSIPGQGSAFQLYFPAVNPKVPVAQQPGVPAPGPPHVRAPGGRGKHILYIDDDDAVIEIMTRLLSLEGYRVSAYRKADQALEAARADPRLYDLAVTDQNMPGATGLEVARALIAMRADLPVVILSGFAPETLVNEARAIGVRAVLEKPVNLGELMTSIAQFALPVDPK